jgi:hypothetical protein
MHTGAGNINQELLKDKSIIRQSLAARVRAFGVRSMKTPHRGKEKRARTHINSTHWRCGNPDPLNARALPASPSLDVLATGSATPIRACLPLSVKKESK